MVLALLTLPGELTIHRAKNDGRCGLFYNVLRSSGASPNFSIIFASPKSPVAGSPLPAECHSAGMSR